ncbi:MAG: hypothetical protein FJ405_15405 [Verrucomicrobia bacterium]|nr:hypothetical protein [Verrucomicrobiota bacterium]
MRVGNGTIAPGRGSSGFTSGFTLTELLVTFSAGLLLLILLVQQFQQARRATRINPLQCQENLRLIGFALSEFSMDHADRYPWEVAANEGGSKDQVGSGQAAPHFRALTRHIRNTRVLRCPLDPYRMREMSMDAIQDTGISYFINISAAPANRSAVLLGDRTVSTSPDLTTGELEVKSSSKLQWVKLSSEAPGHMKASAPESAGNVYLGSASMIETSTLQLRHLLRPIGSGAHLWLLP